jgi:hypothetical protein
MSRFQQKELNGYTLRSGFEYRVGLLLNELEIPWTYEEYSYEYETTVRGGTCRSCGGNDIGQTRFYTPDFFLWGASVILEVKGRFTGANRQTLRDVRRYQQDLDVRLVFQSNNVYSKSTKRRYSDWAEQYGFGYYTGLVDFRRGMLDELKSK